MNEQWRDYQRIEAAIRYIEENHQDQPDLETVAEQVGLSPFHFQRMFTEWAGVSPKRFLQAITAEHAKQLLDQSTSVLETSFEVGLSGPGRLHDLMVTVEAMSPGEYKLKGSGLDIKYGFHDSPFGECLIATTERGICGLQFVETTREVALESLRHDFPAATFIEDEETASLVNRIFLEPKTGKPFHLLLRGTNFQVQVWRALLGLPAGALASYQDIAQQIGNPAATRAVAGAISKNRIGYLIPCHRVISQSGAIHGYRWGTARKKAMVGWELVKA